MNNSNYIDTIYDLKSHPATNYPAQLAYYLRERFKMPYGGALVDLGCGRGDFMYAFRKAGMKAFGVDGEEARGGSGIIGKIDLESDRLPFEDNSVDVVFNKSVMEHLHKPDNMLNESYRILKPGGRIISMVPDWKSCMYIYYDDHTHVQPYTEIGLRDCLRIFGFKDVTSERFYQLPIVWEHPSVKAVCRALQFLGPVKKVFKNKFFRFSRELIILASGIK